MKSITTTTAYRVATRIGNDSHSLSSQRRFLGKRSFSSLWIWTATTCLVATTTPSRPLAFAFVIRTRSCLGDSKRYFSQGLAATKSEADLDARSFTTHSSLSKLLREFDYDALILDQFGVLHNGKNALEGTIDCVDRIAGGKGADASASDNHSKKLRLIVLSNTSSPSETTLDRLQTKLGFERSYFCGAVTSGEESARHIRETYGREPQQKRKFVWCTWDSSNENVPDPGAFLDLCGPNVEPTVDVSSADFLVAHGSGAIRGFGKDSDEMEIISMGDFMDDGNLGEGTPIHALLEECASRNLPLVCANPDMVVQYHDGSLKHMPGKIAQQYQEILGAQKDDNDNGNNASSLITIYGKPHSEHFEACLRELEEDRKQEQKDQDGVDESPLRVAHVGDSLHHDIAGANAAGIPSIFIVGGIHAEELLLPEEDGDSKMPSEKKLRDFFEQEGITPTHVLPVFNF